MEVIGWRDPFVAEWHSMDRALGRGQGKCLYGLVSGGVKDKAPAALLYSVAKDALNSWEYLGPLSGKGINHTPSRWTGDFGVNWEVGNFLSLTDKSGKHHDYLIMSVEGCLSEQGKPHNAQMWMHGSIRTVDGNPTMEYEYGGRVDHGRRYYAPNSFWDPISQHHVVFAWLQEHDLPELWHDRQAWSGMLSLPRILKHTELSSVCGTLATPLEEITSIGKILDPQGTYTISTLASAPHPALEQLRGDPLPLPTPVKKHASATFPHPTKHLEIDLSCSLPRDARRVGLSILHSSDAKQRTTMYFDTAAETFVIDRSQSTTVPDVDTAREVAPHTLFRFRDQDQDGAVVQESLDVRAFYDVSALEVFVNERTAIATRIYPDQATCFGIEVFLESESESESESRSQSQSDSDVGGGGLVWRRSNCWEILPRQASVI
jgi:beta-fructofuranosidase